MGFFSELVAVAAANGGLTKRRERERRERVTPFSRKYNTHFPATERLQQTNKQAKVGNDQAYKRFTIVINGSTT